MNESSEKPRKKRKSKTPAAAVEPALGMTVNAVPAEPVPSELVPVVTADPIPVLAAAEPVSEAPKAPAAVLLGPGLEIKDVEAAHQRLLDSLDGAPLVFDVSSIRSIDTAGVQLLLGLKGEAQKRGLAVSFCGQSSVLSKALNVLGLSPIFPVADSRG